MTLTWNDQSTDETGFAIERADAGGAFVRIGTVATNVTTHVDSTVNEGAAYSYRVAAFNAAGMSGYSNVVSTSVVTPPPVNTAPTIASLQNQTVTTGSSVGPIGFVVNDAETPAANLTVSGTSSNPMLIPVSGLVFGGSGANRTVFITPAAGQVGLATITISVSDGAASTSTSFDVMVKALTNEPPVMSVIPPRTINEDTSTGAISFTVSDDATSADRITVSAISSHPTLVPAAGIVLGGTGSNRTVTITPAANQSGNAVITITASDGVLASTTIFGLVVNPVNDAPTISAIANQVLRRGESTPPIAFTVADIDTPVTALAVSATSSDTRIVPITNIVFGGSGASRTVTISATNRQGTTTITLTVDDGAVTATRSFTVTVQTGNGSTAGETTLAGGETSTPLVPLGGDELAGDSGTIATLDYVPAKEALTVEFSVTGAVARQVLVRAVGPTLAEFGVANIAAAPRIQIFDAHSRLLHESAAWGGNSEVAASFAALGAFPLNGGSADAAAVVTLQPGTHSVRVVDRAGAGGVALVQIFDAGAITRLSPELRAVKH